jgi:hypothetical protein
LTGSSTPLPSTHEVAALVDADLAAGETGTAFNRVITCLESLYEDPGTVGVAFGSRVLDDACVRLGRKVSVPTPGRYDRGLVAYVATQFVFPGGHTFVIRDLIAAQPGRRHLVLLTSVGGRPDLGGVRRFLGPEVEVDAAPEGSAAESAAWVAARLAEAAPGRAFLMAHPHDAAAVAGFGPGLAGEMLFYHHVDHRLTLGVHLPHVRHVDFRYAGFANCRHDLGVAGNLYLPLTAGEPAAAAAPSLPLTTASAGRWGKFAHGGGALYPEQVPRWLAATGGRHVHLGAMPSSVTASIEREVAVTGMESGRFVHLPAAPSFRDVLLGHGVGVYIDSFPLGGCRSTVEAMAAGIPVAAYRNPASKVLSNETLVYPGAFVWEDPVDLVSHLAGLDEATLAAEGGLAAEHYRRHHHPALLAEALASETVRGLPVPDRVQPVSTLERYLAAAGAAAGTGPDAELGRLVRKALGLTGSLVPEDRRRLSRALYLAAGLPEASGGVLGEAAVSRLLFEQSRSDAGTVPERHEADRRAERDLRRLLRRLGSGPLGWLVRRRAGFRALEERYLRRPAG